MGSTFSSAAEDKEFTSPDASNPRALSVEDLHFGEKTNGNTVKSKRSMKGPTSDIGESTKEMAGQSKKQKKVKVR